MARSVENDPRPLFPRLGGWLFRQRTSIPVPLALALLLIPADPAGASTMFAAGVPIVAAGEALRLWAVHHIGVISRTRSDRLGPLIATGPFAMVRNPLYIGNILLWAGFTVSANLVWLAPIVIALLAFEYHAIVRWEEQLLESRRGEEYRRYMSKVPRWLPTPRAFSGSESRGSESFSWRDTFFSERGTLIAIAAGYLLLWLKANA